ncbi:glycosyltransferase [Hahella sp. KA22]|uniref:glycosyltransferase family 2 protein n=1 Tax=Hahella sp. KA22 TaxID=1628392 RepID=UPI000FDE5F81|nr:glycosyltransferase family 2 protein [Hahella sp. KA22]AZZ91403.1 glycosyltransferase family 2 protein [Hahella sp. KA22]QAY54773.1 glycosyltransferase [Hahella sp. KA22]
MTTVDITILSWDRLEDTKAAIASALTQTGVELRVIVVDQGSKTESLNQLRAFCRQYPNVDLVCNVNNLGVPGGRNQAAFQGSGDYIVALDNDAEFTDERQIANAVEIMERQKDLAAIGFRILRFGTRCEDLSSWSYTQNAHEWGDKPFYTTHFVGAGHMIRRSVFDQVNGYDDSLFFLQEEAELSRKLINSGYKIRYSPEVVIGHKVAAERRVNWNGPRWRFHVRNRFYMDVKFRTPFASLCLSTLLTLYKGFRAGLILDSTIGFMQGLSMLPQAIASWKLPGVASTPASKAYIASCSQNKGASRWSRIRHRFKKAGVAPGQQAAESK